MTRARLATSGRTRGNRGVAAEELRRHNLALVLERLHLTGAVTRSRLTSLTGLNRSTIGDLIGELGKLELTEEGPAPSSSGPGRPSPIVRVRPHGAIAIAVELTVDSIGIAAVGIGGHVFDIIRVDRPRGTPEQTLQEVAVLARPLIDALPQESRLCGIGVAVAGVTRRSDGFVHLAPNLGWHDVALGDVLAHHLGVTVPVHVANDADLGGLAEHRRGVATGSDHVIYIGGEVGIGVGVIIEGKPMLGSAGYAGEAGHMIVNPGGHTCRCGSIGCWESEAGEGALTRRLGRHRTGLDVVVEIERGAGDGDPAVIAALDDLAHWLGVGIANLVNIFNPEVVILGGLYHRFFPYLEEATIASVHTRALGMSAAHARIVRSSLGDDAPLIGAAELALSPVISDPATVERPERIEMGA